MENFVCGGNLLINAGKKANSEPKKKGNKHGVQKRVLYTAGEQGGWIKKENVKT